jgi:methyl-accepting chemotaxis protein
VASAIRGTAWNCCQPNERKRLTFQNFDEWSGVKHMVSIFKNLKIGAKLGLGYGVVMILMSVAVVVSDLGLNHSLQNFTEARRMANNTALINTLGDEMVEMRLTARSFLADQNSSYLDRFHTAEAAFKKDMETAGNLIKNPNRQKLLSDLAQKADEFQQGFQSIPGLYQQQEDIYQQRLLRNGNVLTSSPP